MSYWAKFAVFGIPSVFALVWWRRGESHGNNLYRVSWWNNLSYVVWLALGLALERVHGSWVQNTITGFLLALPMAGWFLSVVLLIWTRFSDAAERWKIAAANAFMLILWSLSIVAPN